MNLTLSPFSLKNKTIFICGGSGLIGRATADALLEAGAQVVVLDTQKLSGKRQGIFERFDICDLAGLEKNLNKLFKKYGGCDVWINLSYPRTKDWGNPIEKLKLASLRKNVDDQLSSTLWSSRCVALFMQKNKIAGSIIHCGSIYGVVANDFTVYEGTDITGPYAYSAIKGGVVNVTRYLASYFGKDNIRVNCVCPGGVFDRQPETFVRNYERKVPLGRMAKPEEIASSFLFLASDASSYVTGSSLLVDGGWTIV